MYVINNIKKFLTSDSVLLQKAKFCWVVMSSRKSIYSSRLSPFSIKICKNKCKSALCITECHKLVKRQSCNDKVKLFQWWILLLVSSFTRCDQKILKRPLKRFLPKHLTTHAITERFHHWHIRGNGGMQWICIVSLFT